MFQIWKSNLKRPTLKAQKRKIWNWKVRFRKSRIHETKIGKCDVKDTEILKSKSENPKSKPENLKTKSEIESEKSWSHHKESRGGKNEDVSF